MSLARAEVRTGVSCPEEILTTTKIHHVGLCVSSIRFSRLGARKLVSTDAIAGPERDGVRTTTPQNQRNSEGRVDWPCSDKPRATRISRDANRLLTELM